MGEQQQPNRGEAPPDEIVTVSPHDGYNHRLADGDPLHALVAAVLHERDVIRLAYKAGGRITLHWTPSGPRVETLATLHKVTRRP